MPSDQVTTAKPGTGSSPSVISTAVYATGSLTESVTRNTASPFASVMPGLSPKISD
jgi:hypothetical protein